MKEVLTKDLHIELVLAVSFFILSGKSAASLPYHSSWCSLKSSIMKESSSGLRCLNSSATAVCRPGE